MAKNKQLIAENTLLYSKKKERKIRADRLERGEYIETYSETCSTHFAAAEFVRSHNKTGRIVKIKTDWGHELICMDCTFVYIVADSRTTPEKKKEKKSGIDVITIHAGQVEAGMRIPAMDDFGDLRPETVFSVEKYIMTTEGAYVAKIANNEDFVVDEIVLPS